MESDPASTSASASTSTDANTNGNDTLQADAKEYPWLYMSQSLQKSFQDHDQATQADDTPEIQFHNHSESSQVIQSGPALIQSFLAHEKASTQAEVSALSVSAMEFSDESLVAIEDVLGRLETLIQQANELEVSLKVMLKSNEDDLTLEQLLQASQEVAVVEEEDADFGKGMLHHVFSSTIPILSARMSNLNMAMQLARGAKENWVMEARLREMEGDGDVDDDEEEEGTKHTIKL